MIETEQVIAQDLITQLLEADALLLSTNKDVTYEEAARDIVERVTVAVAMLGLSETESTELKWQMSHLILAKLAQYNPEAALEGVLEAEAEPASDDPKQAVRFKLERALAYLRSEFAKTKLGLGGGEVLVTAADVVAILNGEECHRMTRDGRERTKTPTPEQLAILKQRFCTHEQNTILWKWAGGRARSNSVDGDIRIEELHIEATFPKLNEEILSNPKYFNNLTSTGLELLELLRDMGGIELRVKVDPEDPSDQGTVISYEDADRLIVEKWPTESLINKLFGESVIVEVPVAPQAVIASAAS